MSASAEEAAAVMRSRGEDRNDRRPGRTEPPRRASSPASPAGGEHGDRDAVPHGDEHAHDEAAESGAPRDGRRDASPAGGSGVVSREESALASVATEALRDELDRREKELRRMLAQREKLRGRVRELDARIADLDDGVFLGGPSGRLRFGLPATPQDDVAPRPARPAGTDEQSLDGLPLPKALTRILAIGESITPREAAARVRARGYRTSAKNFNTIVTTALSKDKRFRRIGRGLYERVV